MIQAAGGAFRAHGLGGIGVDGLAKAADLTSGAFYFHFTSKLDAFNQSLTENLDGLAAAIADFQKKHGAQWVKAFAEFYLGFKRTCDPRDGCAVPLLSAEVERAGQATQVLYEKHLEQVLAAIEAGLEPAGGVSSRRQAILLLSMLAGSVMLARAVADPATSEQIAGAALKNLASFKARRVIGKAKRATASASARYRSE